MVSLWVRAGWLAAALVGALACTTGCAVLRKVAVYAGNRGADAADMVDLGITLTAKPCLSAYACGAGLLPVGAGYVDGYFAGIGGGRVGAARHYHNLLGLVLWGDEEIGWGDFDKDDPTTLTRRYTGILGWLFYPQPPECSGPT